MLFFGVVDCIAQLPLFKRVLISDTGTSNNIGGANTSRNLAITNNGIIYAVYVGAEGVRVTKSTNRGQSFLPSVQITSTQFTEPEVAVNTDGVVFVCWVESDTLFFSRSINQGISFSAPRNLGVVVTGAFGSVAHMTTYGKNVYLRGRSGRNFFRNNNNGDGPFITSTLPQTDVFSDVRTDVNGVIHLPSDLPTLYLFNSKDNGTTTQEVLLTPRGSVYFSSYALSDSPAGTFIFVAGSGSEGYKIEAETGMSTPIMFKPNDANDRGRTLFADNFGALVDGYLTIDGKIKMDISYDQGISFPLEITIDSAVSHNIERNPKEDDLNVIYEINGRIYMDVFDGLLRSVKITEPSTTYNLCQGESSLIPFTLAGAFVDNSEFFLFLSDKNGSFENKTEIGFIDSKTDGNISITIPNTLPSSNNYRLQIQSPENFLQSNIVPIEIGTVIDLGEVIDITQCDSGDGSAIFDLTSQETTIKKGQSELLIRYFTSKSNAEVNLLPITTPNSFKGFGDTEIWVRIDSPPTIVCPGFSFISFKAKVAPLPNISTIISPLKKCDDSTDGNNMNGFTTFDLTSKTNEILKGKNKVDFEITFFSDSSRSLPIPLPKTYINTAQNSQTIYVSVKEKEDPKCSSNTEFDIIVTPLPILKAATVILKQCDDNSDGISLFNLNEANILLSDNYINETFTYYISNTLAENGISGTEIPTSSAYQNPTTIGSKVYARIQNMDTCFRTAEVALQVGVSNIPQTFFDALDISECDDGTIITEYTDGITAFDFSDVENDINTFFSPLVVTTTFYESQNDALSEENKISINNYRNSTPNNQRIYVRVDGTISNDCQGFGDFEITVNPIPKKNEITDLIICGITTAEFDLTDSESQIINGQSNVNVLFYETINNRNLGIPITNPNNYISGEKTIYVKSFFSTTNGCSNNDLQFDLKLDNLNLQVPLAINKCNIAIDTAYDLTICEDEIANNDINGDDILTYQYFENNLALSADTPISNPKNYINTALNNTITIKVINQNSCEATTTLTLLTTLFADINTALPTLEECDTGNDGFETFNLTQIESEIIRGTGQPIKNFLFKYYLLESEALEASQNQIINTNSFQNSVASTQTIFTRVEQFDGGCSKVVSFTIKTNPKPVITLSDQYVFCRDSDNSLIFSDNKTSLPQLPIDTKLLEINYSFKWFKGLITDNSKILNSTTPEYLPTEPGIYTVEVTNTTTGCSSVATTEVITSTIAKKITLTEKSDLFSDNKIIEINVEGQGDYEYSTDNETWQSNNRFSKIRIGESTFYVRDIYNCAMLSEKIEIVNYPRFFTPNNDGFNDTWNINGSQKVFISTIQIFNRYGKLLKQLLPNSSPWDGTYVGTPMPSDQYWFVVEYNDKQSSLKKQFKASFILKR